MLPLKPPYSILHFINILLSPNICTFWDTKTCLHPHLIFSTLPNLTFFTSEAQKFKFEKFLPHALSPTHNEPKEPKSILILTLKLMYTYFWKMLPIGALIWLTLIWLIWVQITQPTSNHLKRIMTNKTNTPGTLHLQLPYALCYMWGAMVGQPDHICHLLWHCSCAALGSGLAMPK